MNPHAKRQLRDLALLVFAWLWVGVPLVWGICQALLRTRALFK